MSHVLSQDEVDALIRGISDGEIEVEQHYQNFPGNFYCNPSKI